MARCAFDVVISYRNCWVCKISNLHFERGIVEPWNYAFEHFDILDLFEIQVEFNYCGDERPLTADQSLVQK